MSLSFFLLLIFSYAVGGIPFGLLFGRLFADIDIRSHGSGNIGATNVNRVLGRKLGAATLLADVLKGLFLVLLARILFGDPILEAWVAFAAVIGHCFPVYLRFQGGKGVATAFGGLLAVAPWAAFIGLAVWVTVVKISRISAVGALSAAVIIPPAIWITTADFYLTIIFAVMMFLVVLRHRDNIKRLRAGTDK